MKPNSLRTEKYHKPLYSEHDIQRMLRRKKRKNGQPGVFSLRTLVQERAWLKPRRVEISLGTYSVVEAHAAARAVVAFIQAWGFTLAHKRTKQGELGAILPPQKKVEKKEDQS